MGGGNFPSLSCWACVKILLGWSPDISDFFPLYGRAVGGGAKNKALFFFASSAQLKTYINPHTAI